MKLRRHKTWAAALALSTIGLAPERTGAAEVEVDPMTDEIPTVLTPTRLRQSLADVPASVTVITAEMIAQFGITSVPDALRLVPGMAVTQVTGNDYRIGYHGTNVLVPRRMNVLIDGVSVYRPAFARVDWKELPVVIEDIDRIEVTRGPNSASYGANSMLAIVNIITKHPRDVAGYALSSSVGTEGTFNAMARYGGRWGASTDYRLTIDRSQDAGFDYSSSQGAGHDSTRLNRLNFRSITELDDTQSIDVQLALVQGTKEIESVDAFQISFPDIKSREYDLSAIWKKSLSPKHGIQIQGYLSAHQVDQRWTTCVPTATLVPELFTLWKSNRQYANTILSGRIPSGGSAQDNALAAAAIAAIRRLGAQALQRQCANVNQDFVEKRTDIEVQDTYVFSPALRMVNGLGLRQDVGDSATYYAGRERNSSFRVFGNVEYKPIAWMNLNAGGFFERDQITGSAFSPRIAANVHLDDRQTIRLVVSKGVRMPDIQEQRVNWTYEGSNLTPPFNRFYQSAATPGTLSNEKIVSREIGYFLNVPRYGFLMDLKLFEDRLTNLVSEKLQLSDFSPTNANSTRLRGAELQLNVRPNDRLSLFLVYAYLRNFDASTLLEQTQYSTNSGAVGISYSIGGGWRGALAYYGADGKGMGQTSFGKEELTLTKTFELESQARLTALFTIRHLDNKSATYFRDFGRINESRYSQGMQYLTTLKLSF